MLGSSSSSKRDKYILTHGFRCNIDLFFSFFYFLSYLALTLMST